MKDKVKLEDFFDFEKNEPIQRLAYSKEDVAYKIKVIKKMQELGMKVKIDRVGNICATLEGNGKSNKSILIGSHTDSVKDGGQYDGPAGVISGLKVIEEIIEKREKQELELDCDLKVVVWACEESNRFGKACLGSKWVEGTLKEENFNVKEQLDKKEEEKRTLQEAIDEYMEGIKSSGIKDIEYVNKIVSIDEILKAYELHIEQYQYLHENNIDIGVINSITGPYRMAIDIDGKDIIKDAATLVVELNEKAKEAEKEEKFRATVPIINIIQERIKNPDFSLDIELLGEATHSGSTPMTRRKDAVLTASKFVLELNKRIEEEGYDFKVFFDEIHTENDSVNKVPGDANLTLGIDANGLSQEIITNILTELIDEVAYGEGVKSKVSKRKNKQNQVIKKEEKDKDKIDSIKLDVRMQTKANAEEMFEEISNMIIGIAHDTGNNYVCEKTDKAEAVKTSTNLISQVKKVCKNRGISSVVMPSWAGHDVAHLGLLDKILLFIKSTGGSHNPNENTEKEHIEKGIIALEGSVEEDISEVHRAVSKVEDLEKYSIKESMERTSKKTARGALREILFDIIEAKRLGANVSEKVQTDIKNEIIANRSNSLEK